MPIRFACHPTSFARSEPHWRAGGDGPFTSIALAGCAHTCMDWNELRVCRDRLATLAPAVPAGRTGRGGNGEGSEGPRHNGGMRVLLASPRGFCAGVDRAIEIVERALEIYGAPI
jgi:hypothetical protein